MKRTFLIFGALCASMVAFGQVEVKSDGKVEITPSGAYGVSINVAPSITAKSSIYGLNGYISGTVNNPLSMSILYAVGVIGKGNLATGSGSSAVSFGVFGQGGGSSQGRNIGVFGYLKDELQSGTPYGAGVFGAVDFTSCAINFSQAYAGYFAGDVKATGSVTAASFPTISDVRYKQNVVDLRQSEINKLLRLNPVEYNFVQRYTEYTDSTGNLAQLGVFDENSELFQKKHYGLIAQELREVYPDLVYEDGDGYLSVDYIGIIPLLISSVKELKAEIDLLKNNGNALVSSQNAPAKPQQEITNEGVAALFQNTPNPFNENTEIAFYLPQSITNAMLCVYDMNGRQLSQNIITQRGSSVFVVNGSQYGAGMYLYSLIADNHIVDTKRMILTK